MVQFKSIKTGILILGLTLLFTGLSIKVANATPDHLKVMSKTNPPIGHYQFCRKNPDECRLIGKDRGPMKLSRKKWRKILEINSLVNKNIHPLTDMEIHNVEELWSYPETTGDCEDYVLLKRAKLMKANFPPADLLITVVLQPDGSGHAVLTVRTDRGDYILDNLRNDVRLWHETEYQFIKRQSSEHAGAWMKLAHGRDKLVGSTHY